VPAQFNMTDSPSFRLDTAQQCLWRTSGTAEERLNLPPKAFWVLRHLIDNPGRLVKHQELLKEVWKSNHLQPDILKSHILAIRSALGDSADNPRYIETLRGRGYRFIGPLSAFYTASQVARYRPEERGAFVGRTEPLDKLANYFARARSGELQVVFLTGEPGIGKTALVAEFMTRGPMQHTDVFVGTGQCVEGYGGAIEPYYPLLQVLGALCRGPIGATVVRGLIEQAPTWATQMPSQISVEQRARLQQDLLGTTHNRMLREGCELIESLASERMFVLVLEDLHWADHATLDFLSALCRRRSRVKLLVIATFRPQELDASHHPLKELAQDLILRKSCVELRLGPLPTEAVTAFLRESGGIDTEPAAARLIQQHSGGNPLFMQATLDHLVEHGFVVDVNGKWQLQNNPPRIAFDVPSTLGRLIEARFERLSAEQQRLLEAGSVTGMSFNAAISARAAGLEAEAFEDICEELARRFCFITRSVIDILANGDAVQTYGFEHAVYRQVLYDRQGPLRRTRLHLDIGERLEALLLSEDNSAPASELARHFAFGKDSPRALKYLRLALRTAHKRFAYRDALAILDVADELVEHLAPGDRLSAELEFLDRRAAVYAASHDARALGAFTALAHKSAENGKIDYQVRALLGCAYAASWHDIAESMRFLDIALDLSAQQTDPVAQNLTRIAIYVRRIWSAGWNEQHARRCEEALELLNAQGDRMAFARAQLHCSMIRMISTRYREAHDSLKDNYQLLLACAEEDTDPDIARVTWMYHVGIPWALTFLGDFGSALATFDGGIAAFDRNGDRTAARAIRTYRGVLQFFALDYLGVLETCEPVVSHFKQREGGQVNANILPVEYRISLIFCGLAHAELGNSSEALRCFGEAEGAMQLQAVHLDWYWQLALEWGMVNALLATKEFAAASSRAKRCVTAAAGTDERMWRALAWESRARVALAQAKHEEAVKHIENALAVCKGFDTPLAEWRVDETGAAAFKACGDRRRAKFHADRAMATRKRAAQTLPEGHLLRLALEGRP
jgi:DNA-binding winged helix-turn-helix (wHTH) protein